MRRIRFAVVGTNFITDRFLKAAAFCPAFSLDAVYSRSAEKGRAFAQKYACQNYTDKLSDIAQNPMVDAVYIASPTSLHFSQSRFLLEKGKHVFCEKPLCTNYAQAKLLYALAKEKNLIFAQAMRPLYTPAFACLRENLQKIAPLRQVSLTFCQYSSRYDPFKKGVVENAFRPELSNGALMDIGSYCLAYPAALFGLPKEEKVLHYTVPGSIDGCGSILLAYPGFLTTIQYSKITELDQPSVFMGEKGNLFVDKISAPSKITLALHKDMPQVFDFSCDLSDMVYEVRAFIKALTSFYEEGKRCVPDEESSLCTMVMLDEARRAMGLRYPDDENG